MQDFDATLRDIQFICCDVDGVLTDGKMWFDGEGRQFRWLHARDGAGLTLWHLAGGKTAMISGLGSPAIEAIAKTWRCAEHHVWIKDKARVCREIAERHDITLAQMAFIGDDIIDLYAIQAVGLGVAVADAAPEVKAAADMVLETPGGAGVVRELVHRILRAQGRLEETIKIYCDRKDHIQ